MKGLKLISTQDLITLLSGRRLAGVFGFSLLAFLFTSLSAGVVPIEFQLQNRDTLKLRFSTESAIYYRMERSSDLINWSSVGNPIYGTGRRLSFDSTLNNSSVEFLRVVNVESDDLWEEVWSDEFSTSGPPDSTKWDLMIGDGTSFGLPAGWGNKELQYYKSDSDNVSVSNGRLRISARKEKFRSSDYTSARLRTVNKGDWTRGRFEIRAKLPAGQGLWPAIWMLPTDWRYGGWPASGEIDILETQGGELDTFHTSLHYGGLPPANRTRTRAFTMPELSITRRFHVYALEWYRDEIRWFVDRELLWKEDDWYSEKESGQKNPFPAPFNRRFHLLINLAVGGTFGGNPSSQTRFPAHLEIDYVRVYRQK